MRSSDSISTSLSVPVPAHIHARKNEIIPLQPVVTCPYAVQSPLLSNPLLAANRSGSRAENLAREILTRNFGFDTIQPKAVIKSFDTRPERRAGACPVQGHHPKLAVESASLRNSCPMAGNPNLADFFSAYASRHETPDAGIFETFGSYYSNMPKLVSLLKAGPIYAGVRHLRDYNLAALFSGQGRNLMTSQDFYQFIENHVRAFSDKHNGGKPNYEPVSMYFGDLPVLYLADDKHIRSIFQTRKLTQSGLPEQPVAPLGFLEEIVGKKLNFILQDSYINGKTNKEHTRSRNLVSHITLDDKTMNEFFATKMMSFIRQNLDYAVERGSIELTDLYLGMTMDVGMGLMSGIKTFLPSDFIRRSEENSHFFETFLEKLADPELILDPAGRKTLITEQKAKMTAFGHLLLERNYADIAGTERSFVKKLWFEMNQDLPVEKRTPFPETHEAFRAYADKSPENAEFCDRLALALGFLQLASSETSAMALNFATRLLMTHPDIHHRIRNEAADFVAKHGAFEQIRMENLKDLPLLSAFVLEVLRLYPSVPLVPWVAKEDYSASLGDRKIDIARGTWLILDFERANQSGWQNGTQFNPERWLDKDCRYQKDFRGDINRFLKALQTNQADFHTFSGDSTPGTGNTRTCPGRKLAVPEIMSTLAILAHEYEMTTEESQIRIEPCAPSTLRPEGKLEVKVAPRRES